MRPRGRRSPACAPRHLERVRRQEAVGTAPGAACCPPPRSNALTHTPCCADWASPQGGSCERRAFGVWAGGRLGGRAASADAEPTVLPVRIVCKVDPQADASSGRKQKLQVRNPSRRQLPHVPTPYTDSTDDLAPRRVPPQALMELHSRNIDQVTLPLNPFGSSPADAADIWQRGAGCARWQRASAARRYHPPTNSSPGKLYKGESPLSNKETHASPS
jgi:hypothetical protein